MSKYLNLHNLSQVMLCHSYYMHINIYFDIWQGKINVTQEFFAKHNQLVDYEVAKIMIVNLTNFLYTCNYIYS